MVKLYRIIGYIFLFAGIMLFVMGILSLDFLKGINNIYFIFAGIVTAVYGAIEILKASYFEQLETDVKQTRTNTVLLYKYLKGEYTEQGPNDPPPVQSEQPAQDHNFSSWKRQG